MTPTPKLIHILGAGQWQLPTIRLAKSLGYLVLVTDVYPERPGYALADHHEVVDITDAMATLRIARRYGIDGIICDTTDIGVPTMALVAETMGLPGIGVETALNFTQKHRMREVTTSAGIPNPPFALARNRAEAVKAAAAIGFPLVVKPVDNQSSRGVRVVRDATALPDALDETLRHVRSGLLLVEGFLDGIEVTVESVCVDGRVHAIGVSDKDHFQFRPEVASRLTYPAALSFSVFARIKEVNTAVIEALGMQTGITHAEYIVVGDEPFLVEIAARGAGSYVYSRIVPHLAGDNIPERYLRYAVGEPFIFNGGTGIRAANLGFFSFPRGRVRAIAGVEDARQIPAVAELLLEFGVGDTLEYARDDRSRPGLVVVLGDTREEVLSITEEVYSRVRVEVE